MKSTPEHNIGEQPLTYRGAANAIWNKLNMALALLKGPPQVIELVREAQALADTIVHDERSGDLPCPDARAEKEAASPEKVFYEVADTGRPTEKASRLVWWLIDLALALRQKEPHPAAPRVGDIVVEMTHTIGLAKHRLGLVSAVGELIRIEEDSLGKVWVIKTLEGGREVRWRNANVLVIERARNAIGE